MNFPILYSLSSTGKSKQWSISVIDRGSSAEIVTIYGYMDGKMVKASRNITKGKNLGHTNETTPYTQAISEAQSKWNKKKDEGYSETINSQPKNILPMLALSYEKRGHDITFPCYVQPKLDGIRALYYKGKFWSRKGKEFLFLDHIKEEIQQKLILDGELYSYTLNFQEITGLVRKKKLTKEDLQKMKQIVFMVYDHVSPDDFKDRYQTLVKSNFTKYVKVLLTEICQSRDEIKNYLKSYEEAGYEGVIIRNFEGGYKQNYRSKDLQKYKSFTDEEFKIISFTEGEGIEKGLVIWVCETKDKKQFSVRPQGTHEEREKLFKNGKKYINKSLTVKFQEYTDDGIPRFPVGLSIRNYE